MRLLARIIILFLSIIVLSNDAVSDNQPTFCVADANHSYDEVRDKTILWGDIFDVMSSDYLVYVYSAYCGHCLSIKDLVIGISLCEKDRIFFVASSPEVAIAQDIEDTIGARSVGDLWIKGYPTLLRITANILAMNIAGSTAISDYLTKRIISND